MAETENERIEQQFQERLTSKSGDLFVVPPNGDEVTVEDYAKHHKPTAPATPSKRIALPPAVAKIYQAVAELEARYGRKFTPDGHLVGSIGEVIAAEALGLTLHKSSHPGVDAYDANGDVQIKITGGRSVAMYATSPRLVVLKIANPEEGEIVYDGPGEPVWQAAGALQKNGQRTISLAKLNSN